MANLTSKCKCGKLVEIISTIKDGSKAYDVLKCGHVIIREIVTEEMQQAAKPDRLDFSFGANDELKLMDFQKDGILAAERNNFKFIFADDTGLGKTFQLFACLRINPKLLPCLVVCKAKLRTQLATEACRMTGIPPQIMDANYEIPVIFKKAIVIVSYDMIWRMKWSDDIWKKFNTIILDECQQIKNPSSKRSKKVKEVAASATHVMGASATPAKNHGLELYPILNMVAREKFPTETGFVLRWLDTFEKNGFRKIGGIRPDKLEAWKDFTKDFMIRRKKHEVLDDLPVVRRVYRNCDLAEEVEAAYQAEMEAFVKEYEAGNGGKSFVGYTNLLAYITRMKHLVGLSKINDTIEEIDEILLGSNEKVVVFVHHIKVAEIMMRKLIDRCEAAGFAEPVWYQGGLSDERADAVKDAFINSDSRIMVASTLAAGEGLDGLQKVCGYAIMHERQWNPANEEQCEGRLSRIGATNKTSVLVKYMVAIGTINEWLTDLIDTKRKHLASVLDGREASVDETSLTREMMDIIYTQGRKQWKLR